MSDAHEPSGAPRSSRDRASTATLYLKAHQGDEAAKNLLFTRYRASLLRYAHGRLPNPVRDGASTEDLVQSTILHGLRNLEKFEPRWEGAFLDYLRTGVRNKIRDHIRRHQRWPKRQELDDELPAHGPSPAEEVADREVWSRYESGLEELPARQKWAVIMRIELGYAYQDIADSLGIPTANAARMFVKWALMQLAERMK